MSDLPFFWSPNYQQIDRPNKITHLYMPQMREEKIKL